MRAGDVKAVLYAYASWSIGDPITRPARLAGATATCSPLGVCHANEEAPSRATATAEMLGGDADSVRSTDLVAWTFLPTVSLIKCGARLFGGRLVRHSRTLMREPRPFVTSDSFLAAPGLVPVHGSDARLHDGRVPHLVCGIPVTTLASMLGVPARMVIEWSRGDGLHASLAAAADTSVFGSRLGRWVDVGVAQYAPDVPVALSSVIDMRFYLLPSGDGAAGLVWATVYRRRLHSVALLDTRDRADSEGGVGADDAAHSNKNGW